MESVRVERVEHVGVIAAVIKDVGSLDMREARWMPDRHEESTPGEAVAGLLLTGWGLANRPLSWTPQFCANNPLDLLCHEGVHAAMFNRVTRGRTLDAVYPYGCDRLGRDLALAVCRHAGIDVRFKHLDTTSVALTGEYVADRDEPASAVTQGDAKAHRPDLNQAVWELMVAQDGGVPCLRQRWDGHTSDTQLVQERAAALLETFQRSPPPRYVVADSKVDTEDKATNLHALGLITRLPKTLTRVSQVITQALSADMWPRVENTTRSHRVERCHYPMAQRGLVGSSQAKPPSARSKAGSPKPNNAKRPPLRSHASPDTPNALRRPRPLTPLGPRSRTAGGIPRLRPTTLANTTATTTKVARRPPRRSRRWRGRGQPRFGLRPRCLSSTKQHKAGFVLGTPRAARPWHEADVMAAYKGQAQVEGGFRFLKEPLCLVSSLCVKKPSRLQGRLRVMTVAVLGYAVAPRRLRQHLVRPHETLPNHIRPPAQRPTLRCAVQRLAGMHRVRVTVHGPVHALLEGWTEVKIKVLRLCGEGICRLYQRSLP